MTDVFFAIHVYHNEKIFCKNFPWMPVCSLCYSGEVGWGRGWRWWRVCSWSLFRVEGNSGHWSCGKLWLMSEIITVTLNKKGHLTCWWNRSSHEQVCVHSLSPSLWDANIFLLLMMLAGIMPEFSYGDYLSKLLKSWNLNLRVQIVAHLHQLHLSDFKDSKLLCLIYQ